MMVAIKNSEKVPRTLRPRFEAVVELTDRFCAEHLNDEYAQLSRQATAALSRKRPSPLERGRCDTWACGIVYALGRVNFLFDPSQEPYMNATDLCAGFGVGKSTGSAKSKAVRNALDLFQLHPDWCLPSMQGRNPLTWMLTVNGLLVDVRHMPLEVQQIAYEKGLIPYIPGE